MSANFIKMKEYREKIEELIKENPSLQSLQDEIDEKLKGKSKEERQRIIQEMMLEKWWEITKV